MSGRTTKVRVTVYSSVPRRLLAVGLFAALLYSAFGPGHAAADAALPPAGATDLAEGACAVFMDSPLRGVPQDMIYNPGDGRIWFTEAEGNGSTLSAVDPLTSVVTRYAVYTGTVGINDPRGLTVGPDGAIWFTGLSNNRVGRLTAAGSLSFYPPLTSAPVAGSPGFMDIATGPDGNLWITALNRSSIYRLTPAGSFTEYALVATGLERPHGIVAAPDGTLWFAAPGTGKVGSFQPPLPLLPLTVTYHDVGGDARNLIVDGSGSVWFTLHSASAIGRIVPGLVPDVDVVPTATPGAGPESITLGTDGGIWFTEYFVGQIGRADPALFGSAGYAPQEQIITLPEGSGSFPGAMTAVPDGTIWFGENVRKLAHFVGSTSGAVPLAPRAAVYHLDGPDPVVDPITGEIAHSTSEVLEVRAVEQGICIDRIKIEVAPCATPLARVLLADVSAETATFSYPGDGCWILTITVTGPGGTVILPPAATTVDDTRFPDLVDPQLTVPADITVPATTTAGAPVTFTATATDNLPGVTVVCAPASGEVFPVGTTTVVCVATDATGNDVQKSFQVTVTVPAPTISVPASFSLPATGVTTPVSFTATASSIVDGPLTVTCIVPNAPPRESRPGSASYGSFSAQFPPLVTSVTCGAADLHGQLVSATFHVDVTLALPTINGLATYATGPAAGSPYPLGTWTRETVRVRWTCPSVATTSCPADALFAASGADQSVTGTTEDAAGRTASATISNIDIDATAPAVTTAAQGLPAPGGRIAVSADVVISATDAHAGVSTIVYAVENFAYTDPGKTVLAATSTTSGPVTVTGATAAFALGSEGENRIHYTVTDAAGNVRTGTFVVTVVHTIDTTTTITGVRTLSDGRIEVTAQVSYRFDPAQKVPYGQVVFGTTTTSTSVTAAIGANGIAVATLTLPSGAYDVTASFTQDLPYLASSATATRAYAALGTGFVIWGANSGGVQVAQSVQFWGSRWESQVLDNKGNYKASSSFKGWSGSITGQMWSTKPGQSTQPTTLPEYITVIVTTEAMKDGKYDKGNIAGYAVLRVLDPVQYAKSPGDPAYGTVVAVVMYP